MRPLPNPPPRRPHNDRRHLPWLPARARPDPGLGLVRPVGRMGQRLDILLRVGADMKIEAGKYYRTRGEQIVGPMRRRDGRTPFPWGDGTDCWTDNGRFSEDVNNCDMDLISEVYVSDTPPETAPAPEAKTLRDEFAMRLMERAEFYGGYKDEAEAIYRAADAMMEARKK
jgi:hypothetical protein